MTLPRSRTLPPGRSIRALLLSFALGAMLLAGGMAVWLLARVGPTALENRAYSGRVRSLFAVMRVRSVFLRDVTDHLRPLVLDALHHEPGYADTTLQALVARVQRQLDSTSTLRNTATLGPLLPEIRVRLAEAADLEARFGAVLEALRASLELRDYQAASQFLGDSDGLMLSMVADLAATEQQALGDLVARDSLLATRAGEAARVLVWGLALGTLFLLVMLAMVYRRLYLPLAEVDRGLARVAQGDYSVALPVGRQDEVGRLGTQFNTMTTLLAERAVVERRKTQRLSTRLAQILNDASDEIYVLDAGSLHFLQVSRGARENLGYDAADFEALTYFEIVPGLSREGLESRLAPLRSGERLQLVFTSTHRRRDGTSYPVEVSLQLSPQDDPPVLVAIVQDVSERLQAELALRESEDRFRAAFADAPIGMLIADLDGWILQANARFCEMVGRPAESLVGGLLENIGIPGSGPSLGARIAAALADDRASTFRFEQAYLRPDGRTAVGQVSASLQRAPTGAAIRCIVHVEDVTERRALEAQLRQAQRIEAVGQLAGGIAHDFNNILTAVLSYAEIVRDSLEVEDPRREDVDQIRQAANRAAELTRQLLAFARQQRVEPRVVDLHPLIFGLQPMLCRLLGAQVRLELALAPRVWAVVLDPSLFEQVIVNLTINARDAMPDGGTITISTENVVIDQPRSETPELGRGAYVTLVVRDTGTGMSPEVMTRIFEPFFTTKSVGQGTGLGLAMCYGAVKQAGGFIYVDSEVGAGTTFRVYLPRSSLPTQHLQRVEVSATMPRGSETLLFVEDEARILAVAGRTLSGLGYRILSAADGATGLALGRAHLEELHLVVTDIVLPERSGTELAAALQRERPDLPVLFTSGYSDRYLAAGGGIPPNADFLSKPYTPGELARRVRAALDRAAGARG
ncbi:MAG: PAS domain S-box protein [Gemmatimonadales bacterium]